MVALMVLDAAMSIQGCTQMLHLCKNATSASSAHHMYVAAAAAPGRRRHPRAAVVALHMCQLSIFGCSVIVPSNL
jgi:hypothetical protein